MTDESPLPTFLNELPQAQEALAYARALHAGQRRGSDSAPFILHPLEVAALLHTTGHDESVITAALLHDTVEDTAAEMADIADRFGQKVAALVAAMTEDPSIEPYEARKAALRRQIAEFGAPAVAVYAADKVTKVRELRAQIRHDRGLVRDERYAPRLTHYEHSLTMLEAQKPRHPLVLQLRFELEALHDLPPG